MGSPLTSTTKRSLQAALNNCAFISTADMGAAPTGTAPDPAQPFCFLMEASMLGVGVGFDTRGAGSVFVQGPLPTHGDIFIIPDSREGWVESIRRVVNAHILGRPEPVFDFSAIRPKGTPIRGFGGLAAGPEPLKALLRDCALALKRNAGQLLTVSTIVDVMNLIGVCVVSGNVRRTAEISFGDPTSDEYLDLKNYTLNPQRAAFGWASNNSVFAEPGMDYARVVQRIRANGEPGVAWLHNMRACVAN